MLVNDIRCGIRSLIKRPGFSVVAIITLALGIGANTAIFRVIDAVLLKKLPVREPEQLVLFKSLAASDFDFGGFYGSTKPDPTSGLTAATSFPYQSFIRLREQKSPLSDIFASGNLSVNVNVDGQADVARAQVVSNYYSALGVQPFLGRPITDSDDHAAAAPVAVISDRYWQRRFNRSQDVLGKQINLNNIAFTIIGITPPEFTGTGVVALRYE